MPPKLNRDVKAVLHRVEDVLRRLFRSRRAAESNAEPTIYVNNIQWDGLERLNRVLNVNAQALERLMSTISRFSRCIKMFEDQARAREEYKKLSADMNDLLDILAGYFDQTDLTSMTVDSIGKLTRNIDEVTETLINNEDSESNDDGRIARDVDQVLRCYCRIRTSLALFVMNESKKIWRLNDGEILNSRLELLSYSPEGHYRAFGSKDVRRTGCMPNTHLDILQDLREWVHYGKLQKVYWLNGIPGTGKTTITYSLCEHLENLGRPSASFFCSRDLPDCRDVMRIFPNVSYQLARLSRPFRCAVSRALEQDPGVCNQPIDEQFKRLIVVPLQHVGHTFGVDVVVVIDGLEECESKDGVNQILDACFNGSSGLPVRFLITSRQNPGMLERMLSSQGVTRRAELRLHEVDRTIALGDVRVYLRAKLKLFELSDGDLECLAQRSGGWFLYAVSIVSYASQDNSLDGAQRIKRLLDISSYSESTIDRGIDALYTSILEETVPQTEAMLVLRTTLCAQGLVTMNTVARLLRLDSDRIVHIVLRPLLPVLQVSNVGELGMTLHDSFAAYLRDPQRSGNLYCDVQRDNTLLAQLCFEVISMASPSFNVCNLESSYLLDQEVVGIHERVNESIPQALWYACQHWATHLKLAGNSDDLLTSLYNFLTRRLLLWMEVWNLKASMVEAIELLRGVHMWLQAIECTAIIRDLVFDAWKFMEAFSSSDASKSTPHIYVSALWFWPAHRPVAIHYAPMLRCGVKETRIRFGRREKVSKVLDCPGGITDAPQIANTGVNKLRLWHMGRNQPVDQRLEGHTRSVHSVAYSPHGAYIASGSYDKTVRIWDAQTGQPLGEPLKGHMHGVNSVAYSPDGAYIVSGSSDGTVRIWNARTGKPVGRPLNGHTCRVNSVAYSPKSTYIASGSSDKTVRIWGAHTGRPVGQPLKGHTHRVWSVAYSPDGAYIASGSHDKTIRVWSAQTGQPVGQPLKGHTCRVNSVAYSPDGAYIASGSDDKTICVWDAHSGQLVGRALTGHTGPVWSVTYSPNGAYIVSGSTDKTIRIWDTYSGQSGVNHSRVTQKGSGRLRALQTAPALCPPLGTVPSASGIHVLGMECNYLELSCSQPVRMYTPHTR